ncbi:hypothetical protein KKF84_01910 [Myxococcota bacterium]|nr:hypothetical protein [Myxococcota bacterium]
MHIINQLKSIEDDLASMERLIATIQSELQQLKSSITTLTEAKALVERLHRAFAEEDPNV